MVDALRRAHRLLRPGGALIDVHPTRSQAAILVDDAVVGHVETADAPNRHAAADAALAAAVDEGLFAVERVLEFDFFTHAGSIDELRDYIVENWRSAQIAEAVLERARTARVTPHGSGTIRCRERVRATRLRPL
jgi:hypothetical protein